MRSREGYFDVYFPSWAATREMNTKITIEWAHKQFFTRVYTLFNFAHDVRNPQMTIRHRFCVSLDRLTFCWWRHNRLLMTSQWPDHCAAITWKVISSSLNIDFIHGDIHGRSCKYCCNGSCIYVCWGWSSRISHFVRWLGQLITVVTYGSFLGPQQMCRKISPT